jgi:hypothetical protein
MRSATTFEAGEPVADLLLRGMRGVAQQRRRGHDPAIEAIAALRDLLGDKGRLQRVWPVRCAEPGEGRDLGPGPPPRPAMSRTAPAHRRHGPCRPRIVPARSQNAGCRDRARCAAHRAAAYPARPRRFGPARSPQRRCALPFPAPHRRCDEVNTGGRLRRHCPVRIPLPRPQKCVRIDGKYLKEHGSCRRKCGFSAEFSRAAKILRAISVTYAPVRHAVLPLRRMR